MAESGADISVQHDRSFERMILHDNIHRLSVISSVLIVLIAPLYFVRDHLFGTGPLILGFLLGSALVTPLIWLARARFDAWNKWTIKIVQYLYLLLVLAYGCGLSFWSARQADMTHMFFMVITGLILAIVLPPLESTILFFLTYLAFVIPLANFMDNLDAVYVVRVNSTIFMLIATVMSHESYRMRHRNFLDRLNIEKQNNQLKQMICHDQMTQLLTHEAAFNALQDEIRRAKRLKYPLSVLIMDLDDFKQINDRFGHLAGDHVIKKSSEIIRSSVRETDHVGRYGGEEFIVIMPDTDMTGANQLAKRIWNAFAVAEFDQDVVVTLSGGITQYQSESIDDLIRLTDAKLYIAKRSGKNRFVDSTSHMITLTTHHADVSMTLEHLKKET